MPVTTSQPFIFGPPPRSGSYPAPFEIGFWRQVSLYTVPGGIRLLIGENFGYTVWSLDNPAVPQILAYQDISATSGYEKAGDGFETITSLWAAPDGSRILVAYKQNPHTVMLMKPSGNAFTFAGEFDSGRAFSAISKLPTKYVGYAASRFPSLGINVKIADITAFVNGPSANDPHTIVSADIPGTENVLRMDAAGPYAVGADLNTKLVFISSSGSASPSTPASGVLTTAVTALGFPVGTFLGTPAIAVHPTTGRIFISVEGSDGTSNSRGVALFYSDNGGASFTSAGPLLAPLSSHPISNGVHLAVTASTVYLINWSGNATNKRLRVVDVGNWSTDLTPNADFNMSATGNYGISDTRSYFSTPDTLHLYCACSAYGFVVSVSGLSGGSGGQTLPGAPSSVVGTAISASQVNLTWSAASPGNSAIQFYEVTAQPFSGPSSVLQTVGNVTSLSFNGLVAATAYTFSVRARNGTGFGPSAISGSVTTLGSSGGATSPSMPIGLSAVAASSTSANVSWTNPSNGGSPITGYTLNAIETGASPRPPKVYNISGISTNFLADNLGPGGTWEIWLAAVNAIGTGPATSVSVTLPATPSTGDVPSSPVNVRATSNQTGQFVTVTWESPVTGAPITGYRLQYRQQNGSAILNQEVGNVTSATSLTLPTDSQWVVSVQAQNSSGYGAFSVQSNLFGIFPLPSGQTAPSQVTNLSVTSETSTSIKLNWGLGNSGSSPLTVIEVVIQGPGVPSTTVLLPPTTVEHTFTNLVVSGNYTLAVRQHNQWAASPFSNTSMTLVGGGGIFTLTSMSVIPTPYYLGDLVTLSVTYANAVLPVVFTWDFADDNSTAIGQTVTHRLNTEGRFLAYVTAVDAAGATKYFGKTFVVREDPSPVDVNATASPSNALVGATVVFQVTASGGTAPYTATWSFPDGQTGTGLTVSKVFSNAGNFSAQVVVTDSAGNSTTDDVNFLINPTGVSGTPGVPLNVRVTPGNASAEIVWNPPLFDGGAPVVNYKLYRQNNPVVSVVVPGNSNQYTWIGLVNDTEYSFYLSAINTNGEGATSPPIFATPSASGGSVAIPTSLGEIDYNYRAFFEAPVVLDRNRADYGSYIYPESISDFSFATVTGDGVSYPITLTSPELDLYLYVDGDLKTISLSPGAYSIESALAAIQAECVNQNLPILPRKILDQLGLQHTLKGEEHTLTLAEADSLGFPLPNSVNTRMFGFSPIQLPPTEYPVVENHVPTPEYDARTYKALVESRPLYTTRNVILIDPEDSELQLPNTYVKPNSVSMKWSKSNGNIVYARDFKGDGNITIRTVEVQADGTLEYFYSAPVATLDYVTGLLSATGVEFVLPEYDQVRGKPSIQYAWTIAKSSIYDHIWYQTPHFVVKLRGASPQYVSKVQLDFLSKRIDLIRPANTVLDKFFVVPQIEEQLVIREEVVVNLLEGIAPPFLVVSPTPILPYGSFDVTVTNPDLQFDMSPNSIDII